MVPLGKAQTEMRSAAMAKPFIGSANVKLCLLRQKIRYASVRRSHRSYTYTHIHNRSHIRNVYTHTNALLEQSYGVQSAQRNATEDYAYPAFVVLRDEHSNEIAIDRQPCLKQ